MVYYPIHCHLIERRFDEAYLDVKNDLSGMTLREKHLEGSLPLHIAIQVGAPDDLVIAIYLAYPEAANIGGPNGKTALELASGIHRRKIREVLMGNCDTDDSQCVTDTFACNNSIENCNSFRRTQEMTTITDEKKYISIASCDSSSSSLYQHPPKVATGCTCTRTSDLSCDSCQHFSKLRFADEKMDSTTVSCDGSSAYQHPPILTNSDENHKRNNQREMAEMRAAALLAYLKSRDTGRDTER
mmetsp:Transcript_27686/g.42928  ORF Transcript_27686/g.42928 Transcript_27686/m.42928 type:complete len:243 (+) Transcript_27686:106-834(+)